MSTPTGQRRNGVHWLHLLWLSVLVFQPIFDPAARWWHWAIVAVVPALVVPMFIVGMRAPDRARWACLVPMTAVGALALPVNPSASVVFVYVAAVAAATEAKPVALRWMAGVVLLAIAETPLSLVPMPWRLWGVVAPLLLVWVVGLAVMQDTEKDRERDELRLRNTRAEHLATLAERERIARDLHDLLGHSLTAVVVRAQLVQALVDTDPAAAGAAASQIEDTARDALSEVRRAVSGWRTASLDDELAAGRDMLSDVGVELRVDRSGAPPLPASTEHELAWVVREALTNVARHARAHTCQVALTHDSAGLRLVIADDGVGARGREGTGMTGMRERVAALGGTLAVAGPGTTVTASVPT